MLCLDNRVLREDDDAGFGHVEEFLVAFQVVPNLEAGRNMQAFLDDGATHLRARPDGYVREEDGFLYEGVLLDGDAGGEDALDHGAPADNAA